MDETLESLRRQLSDFEFTQCGMVHERVQREAGGDVPVRNSAVDHGYLRAEYCSSAVRRRRLGCAHTMARIEFEAILNALPQPLFEEARVGRWKNTLQELDRLVIEVDWQKSDAELDHARQCDPLNEGDAVGQQVEDTDRRLQALIDSHGQYVERLQALRDEVLAAVVAVQRAHEVQGGYSDGRVGKPGN